LNAVPKHPDIPRFNRQGWGGLARSWFWLVSAAALLAAVGSVVGLSAGNVIYGQETEIFADQAAAQDLVNLLLVAPLTVLLGRLPPGARYGPTSSGWGASLFLVWVAVLGLTLFALIGAGLATTDTAAVQADFVGRAPVGQHGS
jgi:hypothetical protein